MINKRLKKQKGQSLLFVAILIVILISGVFFVNDIGNVVHTKIKFQNGADAAALSAVSLKISKHHMDQMVRTSMFHESMSAQMQQRAAQALLWGILLDIDNSKQVVVVNPITDVGGGVPSQPQQPIGPIPPTDKQRNDAKEYRDMVNQTYRHVIKMHRERVALEEYYKWLSDKDFGVAPKAVAEVAKLGLRANTLGLMDPKNPALAENLNILNNGKDDLLESNGKWSDTISGIAYGSEGSLISGNFGKTIIEFDSKGIVSSQGVSFLKYDKNYLLTTNAAAKIVSSEELRPGDRTMIRIPGSLSFPDSVADLLNPDPMSGVFLPFEMLWYSPSLMAIEKKPGKTVH